MQEKTRCIILRTVKYGDQSLIIDTLSRECGRLSMVWRVPKSGKGKVRKQYFQPLSVLEVVYDRRASTSLPQLKDARLAEPYVSLPFDPVKLSVAFFIAEFLSMSTRDEQCDTSLYDFVEKSLVWYDATSGAPANFHLMFMMRISWFLGFYPDMDSYSPRTFFDMRAGEFAPNAPLHRDFLHPDEASRIALLMRMSPANMHLFRFSHDERNRIVELLLRFYSLHIPGFREMKSWEVLKAIYSPSRGGLGRGASI